MDAITVIGQKILPAVNSIKALESLLTTPFQTIILLNMHLTQLKPVVTLGKQHQKNMFLHVDLIDGLKSDEYATEFLAQEIRPAGVITTRNSVVTTAKKKGLVTIQRLFLIDQMGLENSYLQVERTKPDYVEVLPGVIPHMIKEVYERTNIPVIAGGLIRTKEEMDRAIDSGAVAITTSRKELWNAALKDIQNNK